MNKDIAALRENYSLSTLSREELLADPMDQFKKWFEDARAAEIAEPNAMTLATLGTDGRISSRVVLLKEIVAKGIIFYTNYESKKAEEILNHPQVAVNFLWKEIQRQVRLEGSAEKVSRDKSMSYFQSRPKASQIGAWVSAQSTVIKDRVALEDYQKELIKKHENDSSLPLPENWGGYLIKIDFYEFWQGRRSRLHDRFCYQKKEQEWIIDRLAP